MGYTKHKSEESMEDYLETILELSKKLPVVRSIDIANELEYKKPSVSVAMKNLRELDYITMEQSGYIYLTESGLKRAEEVLEKHTLFTEWLVSLGVDPKVARMDACRMEHDISTESFMAIKTFISSLADRS